MPNKKTDIIETSLRLFCTQGFQGTGIDYICQEANVAKMTLYKHFQSKNNLIYATLDFYFSQLTIHVFNKAEAQSNDPALQLEALFDMAQQWIQTECYWGSALQKVASEMDDVNHPIHQYALNLITQQQEWIKQRVKQTGVQQPTYVAEIIGILYIGMLARVQIMRCHECCTYAKLAVRNLLNLSTS